MSDKFLYYEDLLGKPFELGARGPEKYDCWGLCLEIGKRVNINFPKVFTPYTTQDQDDLIKNRLDNDFIQLKRPEPFCLVTFRVTPPYVDHCGIVLKNTNTFIHTITNHSVCVQRLDHKFYIKKIAGFYRLCD